MRTIKTVFDEIMGSSLFRIGGPDIDIINLLIELGDTVAESVTDESVWYIGEGGECSLLDFFVGAYWAMTDCHDGGRGYKALCALGRVFQPGMSQLDNDESSSENYAYRVVCHAVCPESTPSPYGDDQADD